MGKRLGQPSKRGKISREALLDAMSETRGFTTIEICACVGRDFSSVLQMLASLEIDGCVRRGVGTRAPNGKYPPKWFATGELLPEAFESTATCHTRSPRFDFTALITAWPANGEPHTRHPVARRVTHV